MVTRTALGMGMLGLFASVVGCGGDDGNRVDAGPTADAPPPAFAGVTIPLQSFGGIEYTAPLTVGGQLFSTQVDTGSTVTAVASTTCTACGVTPEYTPGSGATDKLKTDDAQYADQSGWHGEVFEDRAGLSADTMVTLDFVSITSQSNKFFTDNSYQGILGLGPAALLDPGTSAYPDVLAAGGTTEIMAFQMCPDRGQLFLGGYDKAAALTAPVLTPMVPNDPFYEVEIASLGLGSDSLGSAASAFGNTTVDTGTSISFVPTTIATALLAKVNAAPGFQALFPGQMFANTNTGGCVNLGTVTPTQIDAMLPPLTISFPTTDGSAPKVLSLAPTRSYIWIDTVDGGTPDACISITDSGGSAQDGSLIGDTLMQSFVTVFDVPAKQMGFAPEAGCAEATTTAAPVPPGAVAAAPRRSDGPWWMTSPHAHVPPRFAQMYLQAHAPK